MSLKDKTYKILKERIIVCKYLPGSILNERETIEELGISRTPFREAVNALSHEGWLEPVPHKGILISEITLKDVLDLYSIREQLEPFAVSLAVGNVPDDVLERCYTSLKETAFSSQLDFNLGAAQEDEDLHRMILQYADNKLLSRMMEEIYDHNHRIRVLSMKKGMDVMKTTAHQHFQIIDAMRKQDLNSASHAMQEHIISSKNRALDAILNQHSNLTIAFQPAD